ncbi:MAG: hypothetical protein ACYDHE_23520, partial [Candidatus Acidiferrales bacterium]
MKITTGKSACATAKRRPTLEIREQIALDNNIYICRLYLANMKTPRLSPQTLRVLERFVERPTAWRYG